MSKDLRFYARFEFAECAMVYEDKHSEPYRAMLVDIGLGGVQLRSKEHLPVNEPLTISIGQDGAPPISIRGKVRYSNVDHEGMWISGFKFAPESHEERVLIAEFVHGVFQRQWRQIA
jgi:hypothetical protein